MARGVYWRGESILARRIFERREGWREVGEVQARSVWRGGGQNTIRRKEY
jgi:hypothetical protein